LSRKHLWKGFQGRVEVVGVLERVVSRTIGGES